MNEYSLAYFLFILSSKRSISIGMERKNNLERFETLRLNSTRTCSYGPNIEVWGIG